MQNPKTTISGYIVAFGTILALLGQLLPGRYGTVVTSVAIAVAGAGAALAGISAQDGGK